MGSVIGIASGPVVTLRRHRARSELECQCAVVVSSPCTRRSRLVPPALGQSLSARRLLLAECNAQRHSLPQNLDATTQDTFLYPRRMDHGPNGGWCCQADRAWAHGAAQGQAREPGCSLLALARALLDPRLVLTGHHPLVTAVSKRYWGKAVSTTERERTASLQTANVIAYRESPSRFLGRSQESLSKPGQLNRV